MVDKLLPKLSQNLLEMLNDNDPHSKIFRRYRSMYFQRILSTNERKNDGTLVNISESIQF